MLYEQTLHLPDDEVVEVEAKQLSQFHSIFFLILSTSVLQDQKQERESRVMFLFIQILPLIIHLLLQMDEVLEVMPRVLQQVQQERQVR